MYMYRLWLSGVHYLLYNRLTGHTGAGRNLDESFVMLTGSASLLQQPGGPMRNASHAVPMQALDDRFAQLARTFELASGETAVIHPPHAPVPA